MKKLPLSMQTFEKVIHDKCLYVDKTEDIHRLITSGDYIFISRPRRFGKSLMVSTLKEIFSGNKELFKGFYIYDKIDWKKYPVIDILPEQKTIKNKGGTMRLGSCKAIVNSKVKELYGREEIYERHRHRYEVNPDFHKILLEKGLVFSGTSEDRRLVEFIELPKHKFFVATQAHPEFKSTFLKPAPLFNGFVKACAF